MNFIIDIIHSLYTIMYIKGSIDFDPKQRSICEIETQLSLIIKNREDPVQFHITRNYCIFVYVLRHIFFIIHVNVLLVI